MARHFRIHPAFGIARMGNSPEHFIGPETPGVPGNRDGNGNFKSFRDASGRILRQGSRFRVFEYDEDANGKLSNPREVEVAGEIEDIEWRVHLCNRKASFFVFYGLEGEKDNYSTRQSLPADMPFKKDPDRTNKRNPEVLPQQRHHLDIDPGEAVISKKHPNDVELQNLNAAIPIKSLGTLRVDPDGRLIVLGGYGESNSTESPPRQINEYANNDTWYDDASDGSVKARIRLKDGTQFDADPAWVSVGPPKFAPAIGNVVTLFDTLWDVAVREVNIPASMPLTPALSELLRQKDIWNSTKSLKGFPVSFVRHIYPLLKRAFGARDVHVSGDENAHYHETLTDWPTLSMLSGPAQDLQEANDARKEIFRWIRDPDADENDVQWKSMPRGLGDNYTALDEGSPDLRSFLSLTRIQYALLREWADGNFKSDWPGTEPSLTENPKPTPDELDQAALENCVGGPFYPGIEVSWLVRVSKLYSEPFRLKSPREPDAEVKSSPDAIGALEFRPGFFSQQMALPWQADFYDCHKEDWDEPGGDKLYFMWWSAQRPDDTLPAGQKTQRRWVASLGGGADDEDFDELENVARFTQMQQNWTRLKFITVKNDEDRYEEEP